VRAERSLAILAKGLPHTLGSSEIIFRRRLRPIFTAFARLLFLSLLSTSHFHHNVSRTQQACHAWRRRSGDRLSVVPFLSSREAVVGFFYRNRLFHLLYSWHRHTLCLIDKLQVLGAREGAIKVRHFRLTSSLLWP